MVPEIRSETDKIFCHFGPFFALLPPSPPNDPKYQNYEKKKKMEKTPRDIIILLKCTINDNHIMCGS